MGARFRPVAGIARAGILTREQGTWTLRDAMGSVVARQMLRLSGFYRHHREWGCVRCGAGTHQRVFSHLYDANFRGDLRCSRWN